MIFISYRIADSNDLVARLADDITQEFGSLWVFRDKLRLEGGSDWPDEIEGNAKKCRVMLVVIGPRWQSVQIETGKLKGYPRLHDENDWVRREITIALQNDKTVIPLLVAGASLPDEEWLDNIGLRKLHSKHGVLLRSDNDYHTDLKKLIALLREKCPELPPPKPDSSAAVPPTTAVVSGSTNDRIDPPGLRSFEAGAHSSYLRLVPGPRDSKGLPSVIARWKQLIEQVDPSRTFRIAYWYGPSGCGKSSLIRAGLIPALADYVVPLCINATVDGTEATVLAELRKVVGPLPADLDLPSSCQWIVRNPDVLLGRKLLLVLDQFEQWLHAARGQMEGPLAEALRHFDGRHLQALLLARDEFTVAVHRFMKFLGCEGREGLNYELIDLLDADFATQVLFEYGRAYRGGGGGWPDTREQLSVDQRSFLQEAAKILEDEEGKIVSVQMALFAQMLAGQPWTLQTLKDSGGATGVGRQFLEEKFDKRTASADAQVHRKGAIKILESLLPEVGSAIKGRKRSREELLEVSGYAEHPTDYADLVKLLDANLRIITPVGDDNSESYQLAHDYLVPSLRDWLTAGKLETRRGRAELRLAERAALWQAKPENRHLPSWWEYLTAVALVPAKDRTAVQQKMLRKAGRVHALQWGSSLTGALLIGIVIWSVFSNSLDATVSSAVATVQNTSGIRIPGAIEVLQKLPHDIVVAKLKERYANASPQQKLGLAYALADYDDVDLKYLCSQVPTAEPEEIDNLVTALRNARDASLKEIETLAKTADEKHDWRLKTRLAVVALHLADDTLAAEMCRIKDRSDPIQRTTFIDQTPAWHGDLFRLATNCQSHSDPSLRSGIALAMGGVAWDQLGAPEIAKSTRILTEWYQTAPDPGTHSAAGWALRQWGNDLPPLSAATSPSAGRQWFINMLGQTMLQIEPGEFERNDPDVPEPIKQTVRLTRDFFLSDREVTVGQFQQFLDDNECPDDEKPADKTPKSKGAHPKISPTPEHPMQQVNWYDAVLFCNWLSRKAGLTPCYLRTGEKERVDFNEEYDAWRLVPEGTGYRLPTEAEWEYACRAGTKTDFGSGNHAGLLRKYASFFDGTILGATLCASKLPNGWGLFDIHGNVWEWCHDRYGKYAADILPDPVGPDVGLQRVFRGGGWRDEAVSCWSARRNSALPDYRVNNLGFRLALSSFK